MKSHKARSLKKCAKSLFRAYPFQDCNLAYIFFLKQKNFLRLSRLYETNLFLRENNNCEIEGSCEANLFYTPVLSLLKYHLNFTFLKMSESVNNRCIICYIYQKGISSKGQVFLKKIMHCVLMCTSSRLPLQFENLHPALAFPSDL